MRRATWGFLSVFIILLLAGTAFAQDNGLEKTGIPEQDGGLWMPWGASTYTWHVDILYKVIFWVTLGMFILVEGLIVVFCIIYRRRPGHRPAYTHGSNKAEITWTVVPGLMLFTLALVQIPYWNDIKLRFPDPKNPKPGESITEVHVLGQQFKWQIRYPGTKEALETENDAWTTSNIHMPAGNTALIHLRSADVIHSLFIPHMRVKQDAVPGLRNRIWFKPNQYFLVKLRDDNKKFIKLPEPEKDADGNLKMITAKEWKSQAIQPRVWIRWEEGKDPDKEFKQGGDYFKEKIAINPIESYMEYRGFYDVPRPGGTPKPVRMLYKGNVELDQPWAECDYALGIFEIACAELCGFGHYTMRGLLIVEPRVSYEAWLENFAEFDDELLPVWKYWKD